MANFDRIMEKSDYKLGVRFKSFFKNQFVIKLEREKKKKELAKTGAAGGKKAAGDKNVHLTHFESVRRLWFVPEDQMEALNQLMSELAAAKDTLSVPDEVKEDEVYAVRFSEDGELYRARVLEGAEEGLDVEYIDYGNQVGNFAQLNFRSTFQKC